MPKPKKFTSLNDIEHEIQTQTRDLYQQTPTIVPPVSRTQAVERAVTEVYQKRRGRQPQSMIPRQNGKLLFLEETHNQAIEQIHWTSKVDRQDVIRTAIEDFLNRYYDGTKLNEEGEKLVHQYYDKTHQQP